MKKKVKQSFDRGFWSLADQSVVSLGNFLTLIILAQHLVTADYGVFSLLFGVLTFLNQIHAGSVSYPLTIKGAQTDPEELPSITADSLVLTTGLAVSEMGIVFVASGILHNLHLAAWAILAMLFWQIQETVRRALMAHFRYRDVIWGDAGSYLGQAIVIALLAHFGKLNSSLAFAVIAVTSAVACAQQLSMLGVSKPDLQRAREVIRTSWRLGRWAILTNLFNAFTVICFPWALALARGAQEAASFQAMINVLGVTHPIIVSVGNLIVPAATKARKDAGTRAASFSAFRYGLQGGALLLPYFVLLLVWPTQVLSAFYGASSGYVASAGLLRIFVFAYLFAYVASVLGGLLKGLERPKSVFLAQLVGTCAGLSFGLPLIAGRGLVGAPIGLATMNLANAGVSAAYVISL
jgi:O-antigen/teichoic acid export membrane protein